MMKKVVTGVLACCTVTAALVLRAETNAVAKTMTVVRCQYVIEDGRQCMDQAEKGKQFCWKHQGAAKAVGEVWRRAGKSVGRAWSSTIQWSTNAWNATKGAADDARIGLVEMLGGKDDKKEEGRTVQ